MRLGVKEAEGDREMNRTESTHKRAKYMNGIRGGVGVLYQEKIYKLN